MAKKKTTAKTPCVKDGNVGCRLLEEIRLIAINAIPRSSIVAKEAFNDIIGKIEDHLQDIATK